MSLFENINNKRNNTINLEPAIFPVRHNNQLALRSLVTPHLCYSYGSLAHFFFLMLLKEIFKIVFYLNP